MTIKDLTESVQKKDDLLEKAKELSQGLNVRSAIRNPKKYFSERIKRFSKPRLALIGGKALKQGEK